jgi:hypothetical protein
LSDAGVLKAREGGADMKFRQATAIIVLPTLLVACPFAHADPEACEDAAHEFQSSHSNLEGALAGNQNCVSSSNGHDDCSSEFQSLQSEQSDFETAVSSYESECN